MDELSAPTDRIFDGVFVPLWEWFGLPVARGVAILAGAAALAGWLWVFLRQRRLEAENESTREVLASALERERARGELVLGPKDTLAVLRDIRRLAARFQGRDTGTVGDGTGRRENT